MIILDTNVLSEMVKLSRNPNVDRWISSIPRSEIATTAVSFFEIMYGLAVMVPSKRRTQLRELTTALFASGNVDRILSLEPEAAEHAADIRAERRRLGREIGVADALIAGIALHHQAKLANRNIRDFEGTGVPLIDPWEESAPV